MSKRCFADMSGRKGRYCVALTEMDCKDCKFYRTQKGHEADVEKANKRLRSLPKKIQAYIAEKYYQGHIEW